MIDGSTDYHFKLASHLFDVTCIEKQTVALSSGYSGPVSIVNIDNRQWQKTIPFDSCVDGITVRMALYLFVAVTKDYNSET